jgi:hypothetical protein
MKPTPLGKTYLEYETELKEYNLAKTELAMQKVELGLVDDLKKLASISDSQLKTNKNAAMVIMGIVDSINTKLNELDKYYNDNLSLQKSAETMFNSFKKSAQDLGIDYKNTEGFKLYEKILKNAVLMIPKKSVIDGIKRTVR